MWKLLLYGILAFKTVQQKFGKQGTVDVYSTNSINLRTQGTLNLHADKNINMYAGGSIKMKAQDKLFVEAAKTMVLNSLDKLVLSAKKYLGLRSDGPVAVKSKIGSWEASSALNLKGKVINLNGAPTVPVPEIPELPTFKLAGTEFNPAVGWEVKPGLIETIVTRAPTHEPYPYHGKGVNNSTNLNSTTSSADPTTSSTFITEQLSSSSQTTTATTKTSLQNKADAAFVSVVNLPVSKPISIQNYVNELPAISAIGQEAQEIYNIGQRLANPTSTPTIDPTLTEQISTVGQAQNRITSGPIDLAAREEAIRVLAETQRIYEVAKTEFGILSPQAQQAFADYKAALARAEKS
jgi:hypothetical protein